ncbi:MAG TPA: hypothetical protein VGN84_09840 [Solirubrobacterales bacterium]|nr:hypothetical protein [Solirubrobacterales bacterium]
MPKLDLNGNPATVDRLDDRVDLQPLVVAVKANRATVWLGIHPQVMDHLRLEEEPGQLNLRAQQTLRRGTERRHGQRRVGKMALRCCGKANPRAKPGFPALLVLDQEEAPERPQIVVQGDLV